MNTLLVVDMQNDFMPGGALGVPGGDEIIGAVNALAARFPLVIATQDCHPAGHVSFAASHPGRVPGDRVVVDGLEQVLWPVHCVEGSHGAEFHKDVRAGLFHAVVRKGTDPRVDCYSAFQDNAGRQGTGLAGILERAGATGLHLCGLATDYCVRFTALDARRLGYPVSVVINACRGVDLRPGDVERAIREMKHAGVRIVTADQV